VGGSGPQGCVYVNMSLPCQLNGLNGLRGLRGVAWGWLRGVGCVGAGLRGGCVGELSGVDDVE